MNQFTQFLLHLKYHQGGSWSNSCPQEGVVVTFRMIYVSIPLVKLAHNETGRTLVQQPPGFSSNVASVCIKKWFHSIIETQVYVSSLLKQPHPEGSTLQQCNRTRAVNHQDQYQ